MTYCPKCHCEVAEPCAADCGVKRIRKIETVFDETGEVYRPAIWCDDLDPTGSYVILEVER